MTMTPEYFRPEWTCGRYNPDKKVALFYNLIEGMVYFFEDLSAYVIGCILNIDKNDGFDLDTLSNQTNISKNLLNEFLEILMSKGLITSNPPSHEIIQQYRKVVSSLKKEKISSERNKVVQEKLPIKTDDAEVLYLRKVGGITQAMLELTYNCSEKCIHCFNIGATRNDSEQSYRGKKKELSLEEYKRIIDQLYDGGCFRISLTGGDPFSHKDIWGIIEYIYEKGIAFDIYTNAQGLVGNVEKLISYHPRLMSISLYADNESDHDFITRIPGSWEKTISVMKELGEHGVPMDIKVCIMRPNIKSYKGVADIAREVGGVALYEAAIHDSIEGDKCVSTYLRLTPEEYNIILRDPNIGLYVGPEAPEYGKQYHDASKPMCEGGREAVCIDLEGNVMPCTAFHLIFGNLKTHTLTEILNTSNSLKEWLNSRLSDCSECLTHEYCDYCVICPGNAFSEHGDWRKPAENSCYIAKLRCDMAKMLISGKDPLMGKTIEDAIRELPEYEKRMLHRIY